MDFRVKTAFLTGILLYAAALPLACADYDVMALPNFKGSVSNVQGISDNGILAGSFFNPDAGNVHAFLYDLNKQKLIDLGTLPHTKESQATSINNNGMIVGTSGNQTFVWENSKGGLQPIGFSGPIPARDTKSVMKPISCFGAAINRIGEVCGSQVFQNQHQEGCERPMFYSKATGVIDLGLPQDTIGNGAALGLNAKNEVVGVTYDSKNVGHATLWKLDLGGNAKKRVQSIFLLDGFPSDTGETIAYAINEAHQVIGSFNDRPFLWTKETGSIDLGTLAGDTSATAQAINNAGVVVGVSSNPATGEQRVFAWSQATGMVHLGVTSKTTDLTVTSINEAGDVTVVIEDRTSVLIKTNNLQ
jgi:probable HAF family extracellular repeat protein